MRMNADTVAQVYARHVLRLRVVRHKYAARNAAHARATERHAHKPVRPHARINTESIAIAGPAFAEYRPVGFDASGPIAEQQQDDTDTGGAVSGRRPGRRLSESDGPRRGQSRGQGRRLRRPAPAPLRVRRAGRIPSERGAAAPFSRGSPWSKPRARRRLSVGVSRALSPWVFIYTCFGIYTSHRTRTCTLRWASFAATANAQ